MPTAVITESSENTMSSSMICTITAPKRRLRFRRGCVLVALELVVDLEGRLADQEQSAASRIRSRPVNSCSNTVKSRLVSPIPRDPFLRCGARKWAAWTPSTRLMGAIPRTISAPLLRLVFSCFNPLKSCQNKVRLWPDGYKPRMPNDTDLATVSAHRCELKSFHARLQKT